MFIYKIFKIFIENDIKKKIVNTLINNFNLFLININKLKYKKFIFN